MELNSKYLGTYLPTFLSQCDFPYQVLKGQSRTERERISNRNVC